MYSLYHQTCNRSVSSQQLSVPYSNWGSTQTPVSAPSILENKPNCYDTKAFGKASWKRIIQQDSWLEKRLYKLPERPLSVTFSPTFPEKAVKTCKVYIYLSAQYAMEQEGEKFFLSPVIFLNRRKFITLLFAHCCLFCHKAKFSCDLT